MKKLILLFTTLLLMALSGMLLGCDFPQWLNFRSREHIHDFIGIRCSQCGAVKASEGLLFVSNGDKTCYVTASEACTDKQVVIPPVSPEGEWVVSIGIDAFHDCTSMVSIVIPNTVTEIQENAFTGCASLTAVYYSGGASEWEVVSIANSNAELTEAVCYFYDEGIRPLVPRWILADEFEKKILQPMREAVERGELTQFQYDWFKNLWQKRDMNPDVGNFRETIWLEKYPFLKARTELQSVDENGKKVYPVFYTFRDNVNVDDAQSAGTMIMEYTDYTFADMEAMNKLLGCTYSIAYPPADSENFYWRYFNGRPVRW